MGTVKYLVFSFIIAIFAVSLYLSNPVSVSHTAGVLFMFYPAIVLSLVTLVVVRLRDTLENNFTIVYAVCQCRL